MLNQETMFVPRSKNEVWTQLFCGNVTGDHILGLKQCQIGATVV